MELLLGNLDFQVDTSYKEDSEFLRDLVGGDRKKERESNTEGQKEMKFGERLMQTYSFFCFTTRAALL